MDRPWSALMGSVPHTDLAVGPRCGGSDSGVPSRPGRRRDSTGPTYRRCADRLVHVATIGASGSPSSVRVYRLRAESDASALPGELVPFVGAAVNPAQRFTHPDGAPSISSPE